MFYFLVALGALVFLAALFLLYKFLFPVICVSGDSMSPTYRDSERLIGRRVFFKKKCKIDDIYVIHLKDTETESPYFVIKRLKGIRTINDKTDYWFLGDNSEVSYDSRHYGYINSRRVVAKVIKRKV